MEKSSRRRRDTNCRTAVLACLGLGVGVALVLPGCGARSGLLGADAQDDNSDAGAPDAGTQGCMVGTSQACGSNVGACKKGTRRCNADGTFGPCEGGVQPAPEQCNGVDDNCDGVIDEGFGLGQACDGPDKDLCTDDVMTCNGCSTGPSQAEICNGVDDDCNGIIDADCTAGDCSPTLLVTGSVASSPGCVDFPVLPMTTGRIEYPCAGGAVTANLGGVSFSGSVKDGQVLLTGSKVMGPDQTPDRCTWQANHTIQGSVSSGALTYSYSEMVLNRGGSGCWSPCTETGSVKVEWVAGP